MEGLVLVGKDFWVVRRGGPATDVFIMCHEDLPNKEIYATKRMVHITEDDFEEDLFNLCISSLHSLIDSAVVPPEKRVYIFRDKEDEETPLPILTSGIHGIAVMEDEIAMLHFEGTEVN